MRIMPRCYRDRWIRAISRIRRSCERVATAVWQRATSRFRRALTTGSRIEAQAFSLFCLWPLSRNSCYRSTTKCPSFQRQVECSTTRKAAMTTQTYRQTSQQKMNTSALQPHSTSCLSSWLKRTLGPRKSRKSDQSLPRWSFRTIANNLKIGTNRTLRTKTTITSTSTYNSLSPNTITSKCQASTKLPDGGSNLAKTAQSPPS